MKRRSSGKQRRPTLPVFGGISGSTRTTLNTGESATTTHDVPLNPLCRCFQTSSEECSFHLAQFARDKLLQLHNIGRKLANSFCRLLCRHCVIIQKIPKLFLVQLQ